MNPSRGARRTLTPAAIAAAAGLLVSAAAHAQVRVWNGGAGIWHTAANWAPMDIPDTVAETAQIAAPGAYAITAGATVDLGSLDLSNPSAQVNLNPGFEFRLAAGSTNNGVLRINSTGSNVGTLFRFVNSLTLSGSGVLRLNANSANPDTAYMVDNGGGQILTNASGHTIAGQGRIYSNLANAGLITADISARTLYLHGSTKWNTGTMSATGGGTLDFQSLSLDQTGGGSVVANAGTVQFCSSSVNSGSLSAINGGLLINRCSSDYNSVTVSGPMEVLFGTEMRLITSLTNNGTVTINPTGSNVSTLLRTLSGNVNLQGSGTLVLNANTGNPDTAFIVDNGGGQVLTNAAGHTIRGTGRIYSNFTNNGLVSADVSARTLQLNGSTKINNAVMRAMGGGVLDIASANLNQTGGGSLVADGGTVRLCSSGITGGQISAVNGGLIVNTCTTDYNGVTVSGPMEVTFGTEMRILNTLSHTGTITINPTGSNVGTLMRALTAGVSLQGPGAIVLNANAANLDTAYLTDNGGGQVTVNAAGHTIRGQGRIYSNFENDGLVSADVASRTLELNGATKVNRSVMQAVGGGTLQITGLTLQQTSGGSVNASSGTASFSGAGVSGGSINASGAGGLTQIAATSTFTDVTFAGPARVNAGQECRIAGAGITNNGTITVNHNAANSGTLMRALSATISLAGSGVVVLNASTSSLDSAYLIDNGGGQVTVNGSSHTIRGTGRIYSNFTNNGLVTADVASRTLELNGATKTNNATQQASSGGTLSISALTLNQSASGVTQALADSSVTFCSSAVNGGAVRSVGTGALFNTCTSTFSGVVFEGLLNVEAGTEFRLASTCTNNGRIVLNRTAANSGTLTRALNSVTLDGSGELVLKANAANLATAYLADNGGGQVLTNGPGHTIAGLGQSFITLTNQGILAPGDGFAGVGRFDIQRPLVCTSSSQMRFEITGSSTSLFDRVTGSAPFTLGGHLYARAINFTPGIGETFLIISAGTRTGTFDTIDAKGFRVDYLPNGVRLTAVCEPDVNEDGNVDQDDVTYLINVIGGGANPTGIDPDFNRDGNVDQDDVTTLINAVAGGGC